MTTPSTLIGAPVGRIEGPDKVTGHTRYAGDIALPGMLWGAILRSPHPHALILSHRRLGGAGRCPACVPWSPAKTRPATRWARSCATCRCFAGTVCATSETGSRQWRPRRKEAAEEALSLIEVEYEQLPAVFDPIEAMKPEAPLIHEDATSYPGFPMHRNATDVHNGQTRLAWQKGDVEAGFREADMVMEHTFNVPSRHQGYLEPYASVLDIDADGRVQVWCSAKAPFRARIQTVRSDGHPGGAIRVNVVAVGGDFGGKGDARDLPIAYLLAEATGRPIKIIMSYVEEMTASNPTHPTVVTREVRRDEGRHADGAQGAHRARQRRLRRDEAQRGALDVALRRRRLSHSKPEFEFLQIYTNTTPGGYFRAPGAHQYTFALESHTDILAAALGIDPVEFRLKNMVSPGEEDGVGRNLRAISAREVLEAAVAKAAQSPMPRGPGYGRGVAMFGRQIGGGAAGIVITAEADGSFSVLSPTVDVGTGTHTIEQQMVASEFGVALDQVRVRPGDTDSDAVRRRAARQPRDLHRGFGRGEGLQPAQARCWQTAPVCRSRCASSTTRFRTRT